MRCRQLQEAVRGCFRFPALEGNRFQQGCRSAVVQASGDRYLPAAQARVLFGDDTGLRHFFRVEADNHRFGGGKDALRQALLDALAWTGPRAAEAAP